MDKYSLTQSSWGRAKQDTISAQKTARFMWGGEAVLAGGGGTWLAQIAPVGASTIEIVGRSVIGGLGGLITAILIILAWNLFRAPYRQNTQLMRELYNTKANSPTSVVETLAQALLNLSERKRDEVQPDETTTSMDEVIGITESVTGKPAFIVPIDNAVKVGTVSQGSPQTFSGLYIDDSPIFVSIPGLGYAVVMITLLGNDTYEAVFMAYITTISPLPFTWTLYIDSQAVVSLFIPALTLGYFTQKNKSPITRQRGAALENVAMKFEAGVMRNGD